MMYRYTSRLSCCHMQCHGEKDRNQLEGDSNIHSTSSTVTPRSSRKELYTWYVYTSVCFYSFCSVAYAGLFYGWGSIADSISIALLPNELAMHPDREFRHKHGTFGAIILVLISSSFMPLLQYVVVTKKWIDDYALQWVGLGLTVSGFVLCGISIRYKLIELYYLTTAMCGFGGLALYRRSVFCHQAWFRFIEQPSLGSGVYGFFIGLWTVIFFLISVPLLESLPVDGVLYAFAAIVCPVQILSIFGIDDHVPFVQSVSSIRLSASPITKTHDEAAADKKTTVNYSVLQQTSDPDVLNKEHNTNALDLQQVAVKHPPDAFTVTMDSNITDINYEITDETTDNEDSETTCGYSSADVALFDAATEAGIVCYPDENFSFDLTTLDLFLMHDSWRLLVFIALILTPGWGIKLASYAMLTIQFEVSLLQSALVTSVYVALYALGRLLAGIVAERVGVTLAFDIVIIGMFICLILLANMSNDALVGAHPSTSLGCLLFEIFMCIVGLLYGGGIALFYAIVLNIYGGRNYKVALSYVLCGFGVSVLAGGFSSAYSFSVAPTTTADEIKTLASQWYYAMAAECGCAWILLRTVGPIDYRALLRQKTEKASPSHAGFDGSHRDAQETSGYIIEAGVEVVPASTASI